MTDLIKDIKRLAGITEADTMPGDSPTSKDDLNPAYAFQTMDTRLLAQFASGKYDPVHYAKLEMINRGLGTNGEWVGFDKAAQIWK